MKTIRQILPILAAAPLSVLFNPAQAAIDPAIVPVSAQWVVYADFAEMRQTEIGQEVINRVQEEYAKEAKDDGMGKLNIGALISQIMETVGSITLFGTAITENPEEMDGTAVISGTPKMRTISEGLIASLILSEPEKVTEISDMPFEAYSLNDEIVFGFPEEPIVLVSRSREHMIGAWDVYRTGRGSLQQSSGALSSMLPREESYYVFASSVVPSSEIPDSNEPQARILKMTKSASMMLAEVGDDIVARATLVADSDATATRLSKIVNGMTALLSLAQDSDEDLVEFIDSVMVKQTDERVEVQMSYSSAKLIELAEANLERELRQQSRREQEISDQFKVTGELISEWKGTRGDDESEFQSHTSEVVSLERGTVIHVASRKRGNDSGRLDWVELVPVGEDSGERYEAEYLRIANYRIQKYDLASAGEMLVVRGGIGRAQLRFNGPIGEYLIKVGYVDNTGGEATYKVSLEQPDSE